MPKRDNDINAQRLHSLSNISTQTLLHLISVLSAYILVLGYLRAYIFLIYFEIDSTEWLSLSDYISLGVNIQVIPLIIVVIIFLLLWLLPLFEHGELTPAGNRFKAIRDHLIIAGALVFSIGPASFLYIWIRLSLETNNWGDSLSDAIYGTVYLLVMFLIIVTIFAISKFIRLKLTRKFIGVLGAAATMFVTLTVTAVDANKVLFKSNPPMREAYYFEDESLLSGPKWELILHSEKFMFFYNHESRTTEIIPIDALVRMRLNTSDNID